MRCIPHTVVLLLCCTIACFASVEHSCIFDKIARKVGTPTTVVVREVARQRNSGEQATAISLPTWETMRFRVFTEDIDDSSRYCTSESDVRPDFTGDMVQCTASDVLTPTMRSAIVDRLIPRAVQMHVDRLHVQRTSGNIVVPTYRALCGEFTIPSDHHTVGVSDADMVLYAAAGPTAGTTLAWATTCSALITGRPVVGVMNFGAQVSTTTEHNVRVVTHEIAHALGFSIDTLLTHTSVVPIPGLRGKIGVLAVASPRTLEKTRAHFNCSTAPGMELEDEGGSGTALSHWERRNAKDELMSGIAGAGYYTALTMGAMEDLGFYKAVWGMEEPMSWGRNSGCKLLTDKCVEDGATDYPDMFCTTNSEILKCTTDRHALGTCTIGTYTYPLPTEYQYFTDPRAGARTGNLMDYCPYIAEYNNTGCTNGNINVMPGSRVSETSRCVKGDSLYIGQYPIGDVCAEISCDNDTVQLRYFGDDTWYECPEGSTITPVTTFASGRIVCPSRADVCIDSGDANSDSGDEHSDSGDGHSDSRDEHSDSGNKHNDWRDEHKDVGEKHKISGHKHKDAEDEHDDLEDERNDLSLSISVLPPSVILAVVISVIAVC